MASPGAHEWTFEDTAGGVKVATHESFAGEPVEAPAPGMQAMIDASLVSWLGHLKATAEAR